MIETTFRGLARVAVAAALLFSVHSTIAQTPMTSLLTVNSPHNFETTVARLGKSIEGSKMGLVAQASASRGAAARGVKIPGNAVLMVFRNDFAVRMLAASVPAGIEAPLRIYVTEDASGKTSVAWRTAAAVFAPYANSGLDSMALEIDPILERIVRDATSQ